MKKFFGGLLLTFLSIGMMFTSCSKEDQWTEVDEFVTENYTNLRDGALGGHHRCYSVVFPVTIVFPDSTTQEVNDREEFVNALKAWKETSPTIDGRPSIEFPFEVVRLDSTVIEVSSQEEIQELRSECRTFKNSHRKCKYFARFLDNKCFEVELPIAVVMPDGEVLEIEEKRDIIDILKEWKKDDAEEVPELVFPINITLKADSTTVAVENFAGFETIIEECKE